MGVDIAMSCQSGDLAVGCQTTPLSFNSPTRRNRPTPTHIIDRDEQQFAWT
jgi:hypothetical protein